MVTHTWQYTGGRGPDRKASDAAQRIGAGVGAGAGRTGACRHPAQVAANSARMHDPERMDIRSGERAAVAGPAMSRDPRARSAQVGRGGGGRHALR